MFGAMHFIYQINRLTTTKVDSTYLGDYPTMHNVLCPVAGLERMTTGSVVSALPYRATQVEEIPGENFDFVGTPENINEIIQTLIKY